jgi:hypothetical protein
MIGVACFLGAAPLCAIYGATIELNSKMVTLYSVWLNTAEETYGSLLTKGPKDSGLLFPLCFTLLEDPHFEMVALVYNKKVFLKQL